MNKKHPENTGYATLHLPIPAVPVNGAEENAGLPVVRFIILFKWYKEKYSAISKVFE